MSSEVERIAEVIYHHDGGMTDEDYLAVNGEKRRLWIHPNGAYDPDPDHVALTEWERDEYRLMAAAAIVAMQEKP